jgi:hypothetical protein
MTQKRKHYTEKNFLPEQKIAHQAIALLFNLVLVFFVLEIIWIVSTRILGYLGL